ncbi:MAG TPA: ATP-binding protein [Thiotrichales bacterium]|nr:ATP-binding protein [Thiotrichales bacterium]
MFVRNLWIERILRAWESRPLVWLSGVRRVGKTTLARMLEPDHFLNCDLPSVQRTLEDPELYLEGLTPGATLVLDEVHRLRDPAGLLKIAADEYPHLRILATGSSTLAATRKFRDSLTGRKHQIHLTPVLWQECAEPFGVPDLDRRLLHGGLPEPLLAGQALPEFYEEWLDSFFARDILELFAVRNREGFLGLLRLLLRQSGGLVDYSALASASELSRPTVRSYIEALEIAHAVHLLRPFHGGGKREIVSRPKCYAFDAGFVAFEKGWDSLRDEDRGLLWEHLVLDELRSRFRDADLFYWQDKSGREIDFVLRRTRDRVDVIECKLNPDKVQPAPVQAFRSLYPKGDNYVVAPYVRQPHGFRRGGLVFNACRPHEIPPAKGS